MTNFIYEEYIDGNLCDEIIEFFKECPIKKEGTIGTSYGKIIDKNVKDSLDAELFFNEKLFHEYVKELKKVINNYIELYPSCNIYAPFGLFEPIHIQYYKPGGGFKIWHSERTTANPISSRRHLVFMTYLNDVTDAGGTEFLNQKLVVHAKKGRTLIWPADWTHTHRGVVSPSQEKYIVTGWLSYMDKKDANISIS